MTFLTPAIITDANPGPVLWGVFHTELIAQGYTLEDTVVSGGRTHKVYKSAAAGNVAGKDWYLDIAYPTTGVGTRFYLACAEGYNAATDSFKGGPHHNYSGGTVIDPTDFTRFGAATEYPLESGQWAMQTTAMSVLLQTTSFTYYIAINRDRVILMMSHLPSQVQYCGFFKPTANYAAYAGAQLYPLITCVQPVGGATNGNASSGNMAVTRMPRYTTTDLANFTQNSYGWTCTQTWAYSNGLGLVGGAAGQFIHPAIGETTVMECAVTQGDYSGSTFRNALIGYLDGLGFGWVASASVRGDTIPIAGVNWYVSANSSQQALMIRGN